MTLMKTLIKYNAERLRNQFEALNGTSDFTLHPVFHTLAYDWLEQLPDSNISDVEKVPSRSPFQQYDEYLLAVDGRIVHFIAELNKNCPILFTGKIQEPVEKTVGTFEDFVQKQSLGQIVKKTAERLKKDYNNYFHNCPYEYSSEVSNFYKGQLKNVVDIKLF